MDASNPLHLRVFGPGTGPDTVAFVAQCGHRVNDVPLTVLVSILRQRGYTVTDVPATRSNAKGGNDGG